jgi:hypothetical protein
MLVGVDDPRMVLFAQSLCEQRRFYPLLSSFDCWIEHFWGKEVQREHPNFVEGVRSAQVHR